jgi:hypothetical protein
LRSLISISHVYLQHIHQGANVKAWNGFLSSLYLNVVVVVVVVGVVVGVVVAAGVFSIIVVMQVTSL